MHAPFLYHWVNDYFDTTCSQHVKTKEKMKDAYADLIEAPLKINPEI